MSSSGPSTVRGRDALRADSRNRLIDRFTSASTYTAGPTPSVTMITAMSSVIATRTRLPTNSTCRRRHRSSSTPAHGPTMVNGSSSTANAVATPTAVLAFSGEKKNSVASPTWNMPSAVWLVSRTANSLRKSRRGHRALRSAITCTVILAPACRRPPPHSAHRADLVPRGRTKSSSICLTAGPGRRAPQDRGGPASLATGAPRPPAPPSRTARRRRAAIGSAA